MYRESYLRQSANAEAGAKHLQTEPDPGIRAKRLDEALPQVKSRKRGRNGNEHGGP